MAALSVPKNCRKLVGVSLGTRFREVVQLQTVPTPRAKPRELLVRMRYAGIQRLGHQLDGWPLPPLHSAAVRHGVRGSRAGGGDGERLQGVSSRGPRGFHARRVV